MESRFIKELFDKFPEFKQYLSDKKMVDYRIDGEVMYHLLVAYLRIYLIDLIDNNDESRVVNILDYMDGLLKESGKTSYSKANETYENLLAVSFLEPINEQKKSQRKLIALFPKNLKDLYLEIL